MVDPISKNYMSSYQNRSEKGHVNYVIRRHIDQWTIDIIYKNAKNTLPYVYLLMRK